MSNDERYSLIGPDLAEMIAFSITRSAIRAGAIDPSGKTSAEVVFEAATLFLEQSEEFGSIGLVIDHTEKVLGQARAFLAADERDHAVVFYAIFLEHWANGFLLDDSEDPEAAQLVIRHKSPLEKISLSWRSADGRPLPGDLRDVAQALFHRRNEFVHYKFHEEASDSAADQTGDRQREEDFFLRVESLITALHDVENAYFFSGRAAEFNDRSGDPHYGE